MGTLEWTDQDLLGSKGLCTLPGAPAREVVRQLPMFYLKRSLLHRAQWWYTVQFLNHIFNGR